MHNCILILENKGDISEDIRGQNNPLGCLRYQKTLIFRELRHLLLTDILKQYNWNYKNENKYKNVKKQTSQSCTIHQKREKFNEQICTTLFSPFHVYKFNLAEAVQMSW